MASINQTATELDLIGVADGPFGLLLTVAATDAEGNPIPWADITEPVVEIENGYGVAIDALPAISDPETGQWSIQWTADQTETIGQAEQPRWSLSATIQGNGPLALIAGLILMRDSTIPGASQSATADLSVAVGTVSVSVAVTTSGVYLTGVESFNGRSGVVVPQSGDYTASEVTGAAPLASPALTGTPTAPTASALTDSTQVATTAYADTAVGVETARAEAAEAALMSRLNPTVQGTSYTAHSWDLVLLTANITVTLPAAPAVGDVVGLLSVNSAINATVNPNSLKIFGGTGNQSMVSQNSDGGMYLIYTGSTSGWEPLANAGSDMGRGMRLTGKLVSTGGQQINGGLSLTGAASKSVSYASASTDTVLEATASGITFTLTTTGSQVLFLVNSSAGNVTLIPSSGTLDGFSSVTLSAASSSIVWCDGTNWWTLGSSGMSGGGTFIVRGTLSATGALVTGGEVVFRRVAKTTTYTAATSDFWVEATSGTWTLTLNVNNGQMIVASNSGSGTITVAPSAGSIAGPTSLPTGAGAVYVCDGTNWQCVGSWGVSTPGTLLTTVNYAPGTAATYSSTSTTLAAIDTTNLTAGFVAPASGKVLVKLSAQANATASTPGWWGVLDHTSGNLYGSAVQVVEVTSGGIVANSFASILITGLTPGTSYQIDWAHATQTAANTMSTKAGTMGKTVASGPGPALMEVWAS